jgi:hypothetical protein
MLKPEDVVMCCVMRAIACLRRSDGLVCSYGGMIIKRGPLPPPKKKMEKNLLQWHFIHHESHVTSETRVMVQSAVLLAIDPL